MENCGNCKNHSVAGFRMPPNAVPECSFNKPNRELPNSVQPTDEGGHDNLWTGVTPAWCPKNSPLLQGDSYKMRVNGKLYIYHSDTFDIWPVIAI